MNLFLNKNFRYMFLGRVVTNIGDSLYVVAAMWLVYDLGGSTFYTGLAGFLTIFPRLIQFLSGPLIDKISIRPLLINTQLIQCALLLIIPLAYYFEFLSVALVLTLSPIIMIFNMLVYPAQMASLPTFVENNDLTKANSYFTLAYQGIEIGCNAVAGVLIVIIGAVSIYLLDSFLFLMGALIFSMIKFENKPENKQDSILKTSIKNQCKTYQHELKDGVKVLLSKKFSRLLFGMIVINLVGGATFVVLPAFSDYKGGAEIYGLLLMAQAIGSLSGALLAPYLKLERFKMGKVYAIAFLISGVLWAVSVLMPWTWLMIIIYGIAWLPGGITNILINTCLQKGIPKELLGRVFSASFSLSGIAMPLGSLLGGSLGVVMGSSYVIFSSGIAVVFVGLFWLVDKTTSNLPTIEDIDEKTFIYQTLNTQAN
ncbi:MFS transporter [Anaerobacillus isosaccharinicus]|uniref:MFS transporter n=1 Tax=Anaerobacillus isosaccharinicus TaxID=1532552 RepID=A0A1S2LIK0_9BACI|nr:MFS transporter [Anaerobacillus isosaccharinicus]MBA5588321.1 MFS transporter [Anaerobacillus isosaccharinicus]QOY38243.1 MFS transporter [Anaerobacillus isosaccharinicus]